MRGITTCWFDTETAGVEDDHATIQIAAVAERDWHELEVYEAKIQFDVAKADAEALKVNHYDEATWAREAKAEALVVHELGAFFNRHREITKISKRTGRPYSVARLGGHNVASFDAPRLVAMFQRYGLFLAAACFEPLDTMHLARWHALRLALPPANLQLPTLCAHFGIANPDAHDALADVRSCIAIARAVLEDGNQ